MANYEAIRLVIPSSMNLLFLKVVPVARRNKEGSKIDKCTGWGRNSKKYKKFSKILLFKTIIFLKTRTCEASKRKKG